MRQSKEAREHSNGPKAESYTEMGKAVRLAKRPIILSTDDLEPRNFTLRILVRAGHEIGGACGRELAQMYTDNIEGST